MRKIYDHKVGKDWIRFSVEHYATNFKYALVQLKLRARIGQFSDVTCESDRIKFGQRKLYGDGITFYSAVVEVRPTEDFDAVAELVKSSIKEVYHMPCPQSVRNDLYCKELSSVMSNV